MSWELRLAVQGNLAEFLAQDLKQGEKAVTSIIRRKTTTIKNALRRTVVRVLGANAEKTVQSKLYPEGRGAASLNAAGEVFSSWLQKNRPRGPVDVLGVFQEGATIRVAGRQWLAIPLHQARTGRGKGRLKTPSDYPRGYLTVVRTKKADTLLLITKPTRKGERGIPMFILVKEVTLKSRYDLDAIFDRLIADVDQQIATAWERGAEKAGVDELL